MGGFVKVTLEVLRALSLARRASSCADGVLLKAITTFDCNIVCAVYSTKVPF